MFMYSGNNEPTPTSFWDRFWCGVVIFIWVMYTMMIVATVVGYK